MATYRKEVAAALQRVLNEARFGEMAQQIGETLRQVPQLGLRLAGASDLEKMGHFC